MALMRRQTATAFGSAGGLPTVPSAFTWYGGSDEPTAKAMMGRMRLCSFFLKRLYLFQSLGLSLAVVLTLAYPFLIPFRCSFSLLHRWGRVPPNNEKREKIHEQVKHHSARR